MPLMLALAWRRDNTSPVLANFIGEVQGVHTIGSRLARVFGAWWRLTQWIDTDMTALGYALFRDLGVDSARD
jgi:hypothetical protein